jgi:hypothetical protein
MRPFRGSVSPGRYIAAGIEEVDRITINGNSGTVEQVGHALTTPRADDGRVFLIPNRHVLESVVEKAAPTE